MKAQGSSAYSFWCSPDDNPCSQVLARVCASRNSFPHLTDCPLKVPLSWDDCVADSPQGIPTGCATVAGNGAYRNAPDSPTLGSKHNSDCMGDSIAAAFSRLCAVGCMLPGECRWEQLPVICLYGAAACSCGGTPLGPADVASRFMRMQLLHPSAWHLL